MATRTLEKKYYNFIDIFAIKLKNNFHYYLIQADVPTQFHYLRFTFTVMYHTTKYLQDSQDMAYFPFVPVLTDINIVSDFIKLPFTK